MLEGVHGARVKATAAVTSPTTSSTASPTTTDAATPNATVHATGEQRIFVEYLQLQVCYFMDIVMYDPFPNQCGNIYPNFTGSPQASNDAGRRASNDAPSYLHNAELHAAHTADTAHPHSGLITSTYPTSWVSFLSNVLLLWFNKTLIV